MPLFEETPVTIDLLKENHAFADPRYGKEDSISPSTQIVAVTKGYLRIYTLHIPPEVLKKLALR